MKVLLGTDEDRPVVAHLAKHLRERGHEATVTPVTTWAAMAAGVAERVATDHAVHRQHESNRAPERVVAA